MATYSFKSAGKTREQRLVEAIATTIIPIGIKTPLELGVDTLYVMNMTLEAQIKNNLRDLLLTNWGERLFRYSYGANLRPLLSDYSTQDDFDARAIEQIKAAVSKWMSYVSLNDYQSYVVDNIAGNVTSVNVDITYDVPSLNVTNKSLRITLSAL